MAQATSAQAAPATQHLTVTTAVAQTPTTALDRALWARLSGLAGKPPASARQARPLRDTSEASQLRLALIAEAKSSIVASTYGITPDDGGIAYMDALVEAAKRGVKVVLTVDANAFAYCANLGPRMKELLYRVAALRFYGGHFVEYGQLGEQLGRLGAGTHLKLLAIDGERAIIGGRNIGSLYDDWPDYDVYFEGEVAGRIVTQALPFLQRGDASTHRALVDRGAHQLSYLAQVAEIGAEATRAANTARGNADNGARYLTIIGDPMASPFGAASRDNPATAALTAAIASTRRTLLISSNYVRPIPEVRVALQEAIARGVEVTVVTTGAAGSKLSLLPYIDSADDYAWMQSIGVKLVQTNHPEHSKLYVFDESLMAFGSYNIEEHADLRLTESLVFSNDVALIDSAVAALAETTRERRQSRAEAEASEPRGFFERLWLGAQAFLVGPFI